MSKGSDQITLKELLTFVKENQVVYFATMHDSQPKVRPMTLFYIYGKFYFCTFQGDPKVAQIKNNKSCQILLPLKDDYDNNGYINMIGSAKICQDMNVKQEAEYFCFFFDQFFDGADDPDFCLMELTFDSYEYLKPGENHKIVIKN